MWNFPIIKVLVVFVARLAWSFPQDCGRLLKQLQKVTLLCRKGCITIRRGIACVGIDVRLIFCSPGIVHIRLPEKD
jgi:hypothetical protein